MHGEMLLTSWGEISGNAPKRGSDHIRRASTELGYDVVFHLLGVCLDLGR